MVGGPGPGHAGGGEDGRGGELGHEGAGDRVLDPATGVAQGRKGVGRVSVAGDGGRSPGAEQFTVTSCKGIICRLVSFWL